MEFSKRGIIIKAWNTMKPNLGLLVLAVLSIFGLNVFLSNIQDRLLGEITAQSILFTIAAYLFQMGLNLGFLRIALNIIKMKDAVFNQLFGSFHLLASYLLATIVYIIILLISASPGLIILFASREVTVTTISFYIIRSN